MFRAGADLVGSFGIIGSGSFAIEIQMGAAASMMRLRAMRILLMSISKAAAVLVISLGAVSISAAIPMGVSTGIIVSIHFDAGQSLWRIQWRRPNDSNSKNQSRRIVWWTKSRALTMILLCQIIAIMATILATMVAVIWCRGHWRKEGEGCSAATSWRMNVRARERLMKKMAHRTYANYTSNRLR